MGGVTSCWRRPRLLRFRASVILLVLCYSSLAETFSSDVVPGLDQPATVEGRSLFPCYCDGGRRRSHTEPRSEPGRCRISTSATDLAISPCAASGHSFFTGAVGRTIKDLHTMVLRSRYFLNLSKQSNLGIESLSGTVLFEIFGNHGEDSAFLRLLPLCPGRKYRRTSPNSVRYLYRSYAELFTGIRLKNRLTGITCLNLLILCPSGSLLCYSRSSPEKMRDEDKHKVTAAFTRMKTLDLIMGLWAADHNKELNSIGPLDPLWNENNVVCKGFSRVFWAKFVSIGPVCPRAYLYFYVLKMANHNPWMIIYWALKPFV